MAFKTQMRIEKKKKKFDVLFVKGLVTSPQLVDKFDMNINKEKKS